MTKKDNKLTEKQKLFCQFYINNFNATQAYIKAYQCQYATAHVEGSRTLANPSIKKEITRLKREKNKKIFVNSNDILDQIIKIAFSDLGDFVKWGSKEEYVIGEFGPIKDPETKEFLTQIKSYVELKDSKFVDTSLIQEISQGKDGIKIKLKDTKWAIDYLVKHFDMFTDKHKRKIEEAKLDILKKNNNYEDNPPDIEFIDDIPEVNSNVNDCSKNSKEKN
jgi:phage terminase small subunit